MTHLYKGDPTMKNLILMIIAACVLASATVFADQVVVVRPGYHHPYYHHYYHHHYYHHYYH